MTPLTETGNVKAAVIGCGYWGPNLLRNLHSLPNCEVVWACDTDKDRLEHITRLYPGVRGCSDPSVVFADESVDAVVIATPVSTHFELGRRSLETGKHALIEKPLASSSTECAALIHLARERRKTLMVGHTFVYSPAIRKMKELISNGEIGNVLYVNAQRLNLGLIQKEINVAWDLAPHDLSILLFLLDETPVSVNCQGASPVNGQESVTNMSIHFPSGAFATIQSSWLDPNKIRTMTVVGEEKMIVYDDTQPLEKIRVYDKRIEVPDHYDTFGEFAYSYHYGDLYSPYLQQEEPLKVECRQFVQSIINGSETDSTGEDGLEIVKILEGASHSLSSDGMRVALSR